jgi:hypothetical protein
MLVVLLGLAAAALLAVGYVLQQHEAAASRESFLRPRLLLALARRPRWLGGIAAMAVGQMLSAAALGVGSLVVVEPLLAANVLFALPLAAAWSRQRPGLREIVGSLWLVAGLAAVLAAGSPSKGAGHGHPANIAWITALASVVGLVALLVVVAKRSSLGEEATWLGVAAGLLFGAQDLLTQRSIVLAESGVVHLFVSWQPYLLAVAAVAGLTLQQSAFQIAPLAASLPAIALTEPVSGIMLGAGLLGQGLRATPPALTAQAAGLLFTMAGVWLVARSPIVTDPTGRSRRQHQHHTTAAGGDNPSREHGRGQPDLPGRGRGVDVAGPTGSSLR